MSTYICNTATTAYNFLPVKILSDPKMTIFRVKHSENIWVSRIQAGLGKVGGDE